MGLPVRGLGQFDEPFAFLPRNIGEGGPNLDRRRIGRPVEVDVGVHPALRFARLQGRDAALSIARVLFVHGFVRENGRVLRVVTGAQHSVQAPAAEPAAVSPQSLTFDDAMGATQGHRQYALDTLWDYDWIRIVPLLPFRERPSHERRSHAWRHR